MCDGSRLQATGECTLAFILTHLAEPVFAQATAGCRMPLTKRWEECVWTKGACPYNPYYPVTNLTSPDGV